MMLAVNNVTYDCPQICDQWLCWPATQAGNNVSMPCPEVTGTLENGLAYKHCTIEGIWEVRHNSDGDLINYTHFETCLMPEVQFLSEMCTVFGEEECATIAKITRLIELVGLSLSLVSLLLSLCIFFSYRILKNNRTKIHKNLFFATLFQVLFRLIKYVDQGLQSDAKFLQGDYYDYEICTILMEYSRTAMFTWMFIEGLYLHNMITVSVFQEYLYINCYIWSGWLIPAVMTTIWLAVMIIKVAKKTTWEYYFFLPYYWILEGPRLLLIMINLLFLLNIIRVLVVKLRETRSSEIEQVRKAVRAAIFLLPLMGIAHILFPLYYYRFNDSWKFAVWSYTSYFLNTFQGFFVAVLYCFLNGEVQVAIKNDYYLRASIRRNTYNSCRGFSMVSTQGPENGEMHRRRWWNCCRPYPKSPDEKEVELCDISEKRDGPTTITMVESIPMINTHPDSNGISTTQLHCKESGHDPETL
ncbi:hypothetical protein ABEB36_008017 [Hypothenemus hampei]|uniref:Uncharacterized protein n=1 Tax=Hypothenemus hampei TaxID=57062 RepID=A0ABD1EMK1_HYPHA